MTKHRTTFGRRTLIGGAFAWLTLIGRAEGTESGGDEFAEVEAIAKKAGLRGFGKVETTHFLGVGDATPAYREEATRACESVAVEYLKVLKAKGFAELALTDAKLTVVILAEAASYSAFVGRRDEGIAVGGHYDLDTNRLVVFDFRPSQGKVDASAARINSFTLGHEACHLISFNSGLLDRRGDVPLAISEGFATYGETWRPKGRGKVGANNLDRLRGLSPPGSKPPAWIPIDRLIADDELLVREETRDAAYAEAWALVHTMLETPASVERLKAYLRAIRARNDSTHRAADAAAHFGDLTGLDAEVRRAVRRMMPR